MGDRDDDIRLGADLNGQRLIEQYAYHRALAEKDQAGLAANGWNANRQSDFEKWHTKLAENVGVHEAAKDASPISGKRAADTFDKTKSFKRKTTNMAATIFEDDPEGFAAFATGTTIGKTPRRMVGWLDKVLPHIKAHAAAFEAEGAPADWHDIGKGLRDALASDKAAHQLDIAKLPQATADAYFDRAQSYRLLKILNRAGRNLHDEDRAAAAAYNLDLLNGHGKDSKK